MKTQTCQSNESQRFQVMNRIQVYHVGSGTCWKISLDHGDWIAYENSLTLSSNTYSPTSLFLYATGSCSVCVLTSLQNLSSPTFLPVALLPVTSNTPAVTLNAVSVVTIFVLATHSATSPLSLSLTVRFSPCFLYTSAISFPALSASVSAARKWAKKFP